MKYSLVHLFFVLYFLTGCKDKEDTPNLLSRQQMENVMWDLMRADLFVNNYMVIQDSALDKKKQSRLLYAQVLKMNHVTQKAFKESFNYYRGHPELMKALMDTLSRRNDTMANKPAQGANPPNTKPLADSVAQ